MPTDPLSSGEDESPVFAEPWQAHAFALAVQLSESGRFSWPDWAERFGEHIRKDASRIPPDDGSRYYETWLRTLETLVQENRWVDTTELEQRIEAWRRAYLRTPHGQPVSLDAGCVQPAVVSSGPVAE